MSKEAEHTPLLPCPFCGSEASDEGVVKYGERMAKEQGWDQSTFFYCNCLRCGVSNLGMVGHFSKKSAVEAWNARSDASSQAEIARLREALEFYRDGFAPRPHPRNPGLIWEPTGELLDDCGNTARLALLEGK